MDEELERTAYHEAGHAIVAVILGGSVHAMTLVPESDGVRKAGELEVHWPRKRMSSAQINQQSIKVALGGPVAEMLYTGEPWHPGLIFQWLSDWELAWSASRLQWPEERRRLAMLERLTGELYRVMDHPELWQVVASLADELLAHESLESEQIEEVMATWLPSSTCRNWRAMF